MASRRLPHQKSAGGLGAAQAATLLAVLSGLTATLPVAAQPFTRTIANGETVVVGRNSVFGLPANQSLLIELNGELQGRGSVIGLAGLVQNNGQLRAYKGSENATAVWVSGQFNNTLTGHIEVTHLTVASGGQWWHGGF